MNMLFAEEHSQLHAGDMSAATRCYCMFFVSVVSALPRAVVLGAK